jgi:hypothetical protein
MSVMAAEEVAIEHEYSTAMTLAMTTTLLEVQKLIAKKASEPKLVQVPMLILCTFTNALDKLFGPRDYLCKVLSIIKPLANISPLAMTLMAMQTIALIMWTVFKQN